MMKSMRMIKSMRMMMIPILAGELTASARRYPISFEEMLTSSSNTIHVTPSVQGGVVNDPDDHDNDSSRLSTMTIPL